MGSTLAPLAAAAMVGLAAASASAARTERMVYVTITGPELQDVMMSQGYRANLSADANGNPQIRSEAGGIDFAVVFYGCSKAADRECESIDLVAGFDLPRGIDLDPINQWNSNKRYASAYVDNEDDPWLNMFINLEGGLTAESIIDSLEIWGELIDDFKAHIRF